MRYRERVLYCVWLLIDQAWQCLPALCKAICGQRFQQVARFQRTGTLKLQPNTQGLQHQYEIGTSPSSNITRQKHNPALELEMVTGEVLHAKTWLALNLVQNMEAKDKSLEFAPYVSLVLRGPQYQRYAKPKISTCETDVYGMVFKHTPQAISS